MNKILLLLAIALAFVTLSFALEYPAPKGIYFAPPSNSCVQALDCQKSGKPCSGTFDTKSGKFNCNASSANSTCCAEGLYCINSTCLSDTVGDYCTTPVQCIGGGPFVDCQNNTCVQLGLPGDECSVDSDCFFGSTVSSCSDGVCTGLGAGAKCTLGGAGLGLYSCSPQLYCQYDQTTLLTSCQPQIKENATCTIYDVCADGNICSSKVKCIAPFQGAQGAACGYNLECNTDFYCASNSTCQSWTAWSQTSCTNQSDCSSNEVCLCDQVTGDQFCIPFTESINSYCAPELQTAFSCLSENNCSFYYATVANTNGAGVLPPNSCAAENCKSSFKKSVGCGCSAQKDLYGDCYYSEYCGGFPVWAIIVIAIVGVILVLVVIVVIVMVMRRRRTYDTIA
jgi:hypothetical protein